MGEVADLSEDRLRDHGDDDDDDEKGTLSFIVFLIKSDIHRITLNPIKRGSDGVHKVSVWIRKTNYMSLFVFFISLLIVAQHVSGNHVPIIRS